MGKKEVLEELNKQKKSIQTQIIFDIILIVIGIATLIFIIGLVFIIMGAYGLSKHSKAYSEVKLKIAELTPTPKKDESDYS